MSPPRSYSARAIAAQVLARVDKDGAFAAASLDTELTRAVQLAPRDRALATELAYGTLRVRPWLDARIERHAKRGIKGLEARARAHLEVAAYQLFFLTRVPSFAAVNEAVDLVRAVSGARVAAFANAVLRALSAEAAKEEPRLQEAIVHSTPVWLKDALARAIGADAVGPFLASGAEAPPLGIRVEDLAERDAWVTRLRAASPDAMFEPGRVSPAAILGRGAGKPQSLPGWAEGEWSIQEEGSQLVSLALGARAGETVLDACAGRGNKTGALAAAVGATGAVDAADVHPPKLEALVRDLGRTRRAVRACYPVDWSIGSGDVPRDYDRILVDAPCSGVGTLRRRPDLQTRRTEGDLVTLPALQRAILSRVADHVRPGGRLVYAVCSVLREEAEDVLAPFLADRADFALAPFDSPAAVALASAGQDPSTLRLLPHVHGTDGYFVASLARRG
ncbi:MAG: transcription antitermination factor NusB [Polyangiaceae bacterium]